MFSPPLLGRAEQMNPSGRCARLWRGQLESWLPLLTVTAQRWSGSPHTPGGGSPSLLSAHPDTWAPMAAAVLAGENFCCPGAAGVYGKIVQEEGGKVGLQVVEEGPPAGTQPLLAGEGALLPAGPASGAGTGSLQVGPPSQQPRGGWSLAGLGVAGLHASLYQFHKHLLSSGHHSWVPLVAGSLQDLG